MLTTYKTTTKTLVRSLLLWATFMLVVFVVMNRGMGDNIRITLLDDNMNITGYITDTDPQFVLTFDQYIQTILNCSKAWIMLYAMPIFCVVSTVLILNRDNGDGFFEVDKSYGIKSTTYVIGRILSILTVNIIVCLLIMYLALNYYYFSRGGIHEWNLLSYLYDSSVRILRVFITSMLPGILLFVGLTYLFGSIFQSGFVGAIVGFGFVLFDFCTKTTLYSRVSEDYHDYFSPNPSKLYQYWTFYDTEWFVEKTVRNPFSLEDVLMCNSITLVASLMFLAISYIIIRKRNI